MTDFQKTLKREANDIRNVIEQHVKTTMGLNRPTAEVGTQSLTYDRIQDIIVEQTQNELEAKIEANNKEVSEIKLGRMQGEIDSLMNRLKDMKQKFTALQKKTSGEPDVNMLDDLKSKVNFFFKKKLGKKHAGLLKEFNSKILQIAT